MENPRTRALMVGGLLGAIAGAIAGWVYYNANVEVDNEGAEDLAAPSPSTAVKLGLGLLGVLRLIAE